MPPTKGLPAVYGFKNNVGKTSAFTLEKPAVQEPSVFWAAVETCSSAVSVCSRAFRCLVSLSCFIVLFLNDDVKQETSPSVGN